MTRTLLLIALLAGCGGNLPAVSFSFRYPAGLTEAEIDALVTAECAGAERVGAPRPTGTPGVLTADYVCR